MGAAVVAVVTLAEQDLRHGICGPSDGFVCSLVRTLVLLLLLLLLLLFV